MRRLIGLGVLATALAASPLVASSQSYDQNRGYYRDSRRADYRDSRRSYDRCRHARRVSGNQGTVAGALVGGASGALIGHDALGALVGAGVGAVGGHEIAKSRVRC